MHSSRMPYRPQQYLSGGGAFCHGLLLWSSVMPFWFGGLLIEGGLLVESGLLLWPSGVVPCVMAFWLKGVGHPLPEDHTRKAAFNQKATKPEGHNRRPHPPGSRHPPPRDLLQGMMGYHLQCMLG